MAAPWHRLAWAGWAIALALVIAALAMQVGYANGRAECFLLLGDLLALQCNGLLDAWVLPVTVGIGLALVAIGAWRLVVTPLTSDRSAE